MDKGSASIIDAVRDVMDRRRLKLTDIARDIGIPYRSLQNYMSKRSMIPLDVYIKLCARIGITPDYPVAEKFKLDTYAVREAFERVFGSTFFNFISVSDDLTVELDTTREHDAASARNAAHVVAALFAGAYDLSRELALTRSEDE